MKKTREIITEEGQKIVQITGKEATLNAYNALADKLSELEIPFEYTDL